MVALYESESAVRQNAIPILPVSFALEEVKQFVRSCTTSSFLNAEIADHDNLFALDLDSLKTLNIAWQHLPPLLVIRQNSLRKPHHRRPLIFDIPSSEPRGNRWSLLSSDPPIQNGCSSRKIHPRSTPTHAQTPCTTFLHPNCHSPDRHQRIPRYAPIPDSPLLTHCFKDLLPKSFRQRPEPPLCKIRKPGFQNWHIWLKSSVPNG